MGFELEDAAFFRMRLEMFGAVFTHTDSTSTTVVVQYELQEVCIVLYST